MNSKTQRRSYDTLDVSGAVALGFYERTFKNLANDAENSLKRPWHKLERGLRIGRLREFVSRETDRLKLDAEDTDGLFKLLTKALDKKILNSKAAVSYEIETERITEIKGLVSHTGANNKTKYQLLEKKVGSTQKRRPSIVQQVQPQVQPQVPQVPAAPKELPLNNSSEVKNES